MVGEDCGCACGVRWNPASVTGLPIFSCALRGLPISHRRTHVLRLGEKLLCVSSSCGRNLIVLATGSMGSGPSRSGSRSVPSSSPGRPENSGLHRGHPALRQRRDPTHRDVPRAQRVRQARWLSSRRRRSEYRCRRGSGSASQLLRPRAGVRRERRSRRRPGGLHGSKR